MTLSNTLAVVYYVAVMAGGTYAVYRVLPAVEPPRPFFWRLFGLGLGFMLAFFAPAFWSMDASFLFWVVGVGGTLAALSLPAAYGFINLHDRTTTRP